MAVSIVMTGTGRNCNITSGSSSMVVSSATGLVVGATIQGTGIPTGTRIGTISGTTVTMVNASGVAVTATATNATASLIFSSVWGSILTVSLSASGDNATMQNIYNAGFGVMSDNLGQRHIFFPGAFGIEWKNIVAGSLFDFQNWTMEFGALGYWAWEQSTILGELRGGYLANGTQFIKSSGPTFISRDFKNSQAGGSNMFIGTATGTVTGFFRMNDLRVIAQGGTNRCPQFNTGRMNCIVDGMILDYQGDGGPNAGFSAAFGTLNNTTVVKANSGIGSPNGTNFATINGLSYSGLFTDTPNHKFAIPNNYVLEGYAPQVLSTQILGGFQDNTTETYANIDLSTAGWGLNDLKTKYQRYGGLNEIRFPRRVSLQFNNSSGADLTNVTLYIRSGTTTLVNAVQAGDYSANTQALVLNWTSNVTSYRVANTITDTIDQIAQVRKYGFVEQTTSYSLNLASYSQPFFMLAQASLSGISEATAAAITTEGIDWANKTITPTGNLSYDQMNARMDWELAQPTNSMQADPRTINGSKLSLATGWTLIVNNGITISAGTNITEWFTPTITLNGTGAITGVYSTTQGTATVLRLTVPNSGSSMCIFKTDGTTKFFGNNLTAGNFTVYFSPTETGTYHFVYENYGKKRVEDLLSINGGSRGYVPTEVDDVGITEATKATVAAYTTLTTTSQIYDATAYFRLSEAGIKLGQLVTRDGTYLDFGSFNVKLKDDATDVVGVASGTITYKSIVINSTSKYNAMKATPPATITATDTEIINVLIEDANGDSKITILGGDDIGYQMWKVPTTTATDDYATGTLLTTLPNNHTPFRFIGISGFDIVGRDISSGVRRRSSMLKGSYEQAFYVGAQIQLASDAPQLVDTNQKIDELILKVDTNLDAKVSTRLADADYTDAPTTTEIWTAPTRTLTSAGSSGATLAEIEASTILAKEATSQSIKTKVLSLQNTDLTGIATSNDVLDAKNEIIAATNNIDVDNTAIATEVWNQEPERLKNVATVETTGDQLASFNNS